MTPTSFIIRITRCGKAKRPIRNKTLLKSKYLLMLFKLKITYIHIINSLYNEIITKLKKESTDKPKK